MSWRVLVVLLVGGCLEPGLIPCGDLLCPRGTVCAGDGQCARQEQIDACVGLAEGSPCRTEAGDGLCTGGACRGRGCGDGVVDLGEVCDDGNVLSGDGCRGDCLSDETCGNGALDGNERCDCGRDEATRAIGCTMINADDPAALCDPACSRFCGDGQITGSEQCEGASSVLACQDVGFYSGSPTCSPFCTLDFASCSGRCGDGMLQIAVGEVCDGAPPQGSCLDFARDFGALACSAFCAPDLAGSCFNYGWRPLMVPSDFMRFAAVNARGLIGLSYDLTHIDTVWDGVQSNRVNPGWTAVSGSAAILVAAGGSTIGVFDGAWRELSTTDVTPDAIAVKDNAVYEIDSDCSFRVVSTTNGAATALPTPPQSTCHTLVLGDDGMLYTATGAGGLLRWDGTAWTQRSAGFTAAVYPGARGHLGVLGANNGLAVEDFNLSNATRGPTLFHTTDIDYGVAIGIDGDAGNAGTLRVAGMATALPDTFGANTWRMVRSVDGWIVAYGVGAWRLEPLPQRVINEAIVQLVALPDDGVAYCGVNVGWISPSGEHGSRPAPSSGCNVLLGDPRGDHLVGNSDGVWRYHVNTTSYELEISNPNAFPTFDLLTSLAGTPTDAWTTMDGQAYHYVNGAWSMTTMPPECDPFTTLVFGAFVALDAIGTPFMQTTCGSASTFLRWNGTAWTIELSYLDQLEVRLAALVSLADGSLYSFAPSQGVGIYRFDGTNVTRLSTGGSGYIAGSEADLWIDAGDGTFDHYVGGAKSRLRMPSGPIAVTSRYVFSYSTVDQWLSITPRMPTLVGATHGL